MFKFESPEYLYLLLLIPSLVALYIYSNYKKKRRIKAFGDPDLIRQLSPEVSGYKPKVKFWLTLSALTLVIFMLARPQYGTRVDTAKTRGADIMIALDISKSMWAEDVKPSRLEKAKRLVEQLINKLNDDKIGLIVFAGDAYVMTPMTGDMAAAKMFVHNADPEMISSGGTSIGKALELAISRFNPKSVAGKAVILITDGENHEDNIEGVLKEAEKLNIQVDVVGVGLPEGAPIPIKGTDEFVKYNGDVVISKLNEEMCEQISKGGHGVYVRLDNSDRAEKVITSTVGQLKKVDSETKIYSSYDEQYQYIGWIVLILLFIELSIMSRRNKKFMNIHLFERKDK